MKTVKIFGPGCKRCETTASMVADAASNLGLEVAIEKVKDARSIAMAGVMSTPGISIDGKLVHAGGLPERSKLDDWLKA